MFLSTAKFTELPPHLLSTFSITRRKPPHLSLFLFKPFSSAFCSTKLPKTPSKNPNIPRTPSSDSSTWIKKWPSPSRSNSRSPPRKPGPKKPDPKPESASTGATALDQIVLRLRNLALESNEELESQEGEDELGLNSKIPNLNSDESTVEGGKLEDLLRRDWVTPDSILYENTGDFKGNNSLPWERFVDVDEVDEEEIEEDKPAARKRVVREPTLAERTLEVDELKRLRRIGMGMKDKVNVAKAGVTGAVLEKIHEKWRKSELARLKFHEDLAHDMKTAHEIVERRTGGIITWRSGSTIIVYRGNDYNGPTSKPEELNTTDDTPSDRKKNMTEEELEYDSLLDGLGPRFVDWWGTGVLPVDADLLPPVIQGYQTPLRLLPSNTSPLLTNAEMTSLRKLAKSLPSHFALGRNRNHQGLATSIIKLWEKSLVVKIAVKPGIQNTNNELMAEELKKLTGGVLLLRNKYYIVMYRGKDFLSPSVSSALAERREMTKHIQDVEEKVRGVVSVIPASQEKEASTGTLAEFYEAQARWGTEVSAEQREKMIEDASRANREKVIRRLEHRIALSQAKKLKAEKLLSKIVEAWVPISPSDDLETITDEERIMYRKVGLQMKAYLPLGIRGVFDGVIENMHLHWKHRELVKLISKEKILSYVEETARLLEYESGGILVAIERVPKGHALVYYRGKNYRRPITIRPRNLLTKAKALKRSVALQRYEALSQHISELEKIIEQTKQEIDKPKDLKKSNLGNSEDEGKFNLVAEWNESESEDEDEDEDEWEDDVDSEFSSSEDFD